MGVIWTLSDCLKNRGVKNAVQLQVALQDELGIAISPQSLRKLVANHPQSLRIETAQILCNFLQLPLHAYFSVTPDSIAAPQQIIKPYALPVSLGAEIMADPLRYL